MEELSEMKKGLVVMDNRVEIAGGRGDIREINGNGNTITIFIKGYEFLMIHINPLSAPFEVLLMAVKYPEEHQV